MELSWTQRIFLFGAIFVCVTADILPPLINERPQDVTTVEGATATFTCRATGEPRPRMKWTRNGAEITGSNILKNGNLQIRSVTLTDAGQYTCRAESLMGFTEKSAELIVKEHTRITQAPLDLIAPEGQNVVFHCEATSDPAFPNTIEWLHNGESIDFSAGSRFAHSTNTSLKIANVQLADNGTYICLAKTTVDETTAEGHLFVTERIRISVEPSNLTAAVGTSAIFHCKASSKFPLPLTLLWLHNGENINYSPGSRFTKSADNTLTVAQAQDLDVGTYTCVAKTAVDEVAAEAQLIVADVPNPPRIRSVTCSNRQATIKWESTGDNNSSIKWYTVLYKTSSNPNVWQSLPDNSLLLDKKAVFTMLEFGANYTFKVYAWNGIGQSQSSNPSEACETEGDVPHTNPNRVEGQGGANDSLVISWMAMNTRQHNGPGFKYRVYWRKDIPGEKWKATNISDWEKTEYVVANQPRYQRYRIQVQAVNDKGVAKVAPMEVVAYSGEGVPTQSPDNFIALEVIDGKQALVSWNPVPPETVQGHLLGYKIHTWTDKVGEGGIQEVVVKDDKTEALVSKLFPNAKNYVRVMVYNGKKNGPPSNTLIINTPESIPGLAHKFEAHSMGSSSLYVTWEPPQETNGVLTGYQISCVPSQFSQPLKEVTILDPDQTKLKITGLTPATEYRLGIVATTRAGKGELVVIYTSTKTNSTSPPGTPQFEWFKETSADGVARIRVVWKPNLEGNLGSYFFVKYREKGEKKKVVKTPPELSEVFTIVQGLAPYMVYDFKVVAVDGNQQKDSDPQEVNTGPIAVASRLVSRFPAHKLADNDLTLSLQCVATGDPPLHFLWEVDGFPIPNNTRFLTDQFSTIDGNVVGHLNISNMVGGDGGEYSCTAKNRLSEATHRARVDFQGEPFIRAMPKVKAVAGSKVIVKCPVSGYPIKSIIWKRDGKKLMGNQRRTVYRDGTMVIDNAQRLTDSGTYSCEAQTIQAFKTTRDVEIEIMESGVL